MNDSTINTIVHGDCLTILPTLAAASINFVLTDPPYITNYKSRDGRTVARARR
jgi:site-specific DNA-methyltransferase (adenine-specific)